MEFFNSLGQVFSNAKNYPAWQQQEDRKNLQQQQFLAKNKPTKKQLAEATEYSRVMVEAINKMDQYSIDKSEDVVSLTAPVVAMADVVVSLGVLGLAGLAYSQPSVQKQTATTASKLKNWLVELNPIKNKPEWVKNIHNTLEGEGGSTIVFLLATAIVQVTAGLGLALVDAIAVRGLEKEASRVARFQAREQVLQDPRNFVNYTPQQLAEAKENAKNAKVKDPKKPKSLNPFAMVGEAIKTAKELTVQHKEYEHWKTNFNQKEATALNELESTAISEQEKQEALVDKNRITTVIKEVELKSQQYLANVEMLINTASILLLGSGLLIGGAIEKGIEVAQHQKWLPSDADSFSALISKKVVSYGLPIIGGVVASLYGVKIQKEAAKVGRFKAKQALLKHPESFVAIAKVQNEEELATSTITVASSKKKSFIQFIQDETHFFFNLNKDFDEYKAHEKEVIPKEYQLNEALKQVEITPEQLRKAKTLQKRSFYAFEKMDEKTQRYSDDVEGGASIVTSVINRVSSELLNLGMMVCTPLIAINGLEKLDNIASKKIGVQIAHAIPSGTAMFGTILLASLPASISTVWAAQVKKTAAQVGVMLSMKDLQDPKRMLIAPQLPLVSTTTETDTDDVDDENDQTEAVA